VNHLEVATLCRKGLLDAGISVDDLRYEVGLSELGEWMNFRIYLPEAYCFTEASGNVLALRLECFNSVDGSSRLVIFFGWFRFVCSNGMVIGETKIEIKERHGQGLDLKSIAARMKPAIKAVEALRAILAKNMRRLRAERGFSQEGLAPRVRHQPNVSQFGRAIRT
jgi:hypothetical protein